MERVRGLVFPGASWTAGDLGAHNGTVIRVLGRHDPPFLFAATTEDGRTTFTGYLMDIWQVIAQELHLHYEIVDTLPLEFGIQLENGSWTGVVGELDAGRADVGLSWLSYSQQRAKAVEFVDAIPVAMDAYNFYLVEGSSAKVTFTKDMFSQLTKPLHANVWLVLLISLFIVSVILRVTIRCSRPQSETEQTKHEFGLGTCHLHTFMSLVGQGWASTPDSWAARIVTISSWVLGLLIYVNYTANLISYLAVTTVDKPIYDLAEFISNSDWKLASEAGLNNFNDWQKSSDPHYRHLYEMVQKSERRIVLDSSTESIRHCLQQEVLCFHDLGRLFFFLGREACALHPLLHKEPTKYRDYLVLRKGLGSLRKAANNVMQRLDQNGALERMRTQWFPASSAMCSSNAEFTPLTLADLFAVVVIVPMACVVSCLLLLLELAARQLAAMTLGHPALNVK